MKKYTVLFGVCLVLSISTGSVFAQPGNGQRGHAPQIPAQQGPGQQVPGQQVPGQQVPGSQFGYGFFGPQGPSGQYGYGFGPLQIVTVAQARTYGHKVPVALTGTLVQFYGGKNLYIFRDSSGDIIVKIGQKEWQNLWYQGISITPSDTIEIYGEVHWPKHSWGTPEVHVRFIKKI